MVEDVEEISLESELRSFGEVEIFERGEIYIPPAGSFNKVSGTGIVTSAIVINQSCCPISQPHRHLISPVCVESPEQPLSRVHWHQCLQGRLVNTADSKGWVEEATKPQALWQAVAS